METVNKIGIFLLLFGIANTNAFTREIYSQEDNVTVRINTTKTDGNKTLEINFSGYTSNLHYTNVMTCSPWLTSISRNYTGRIQMVNSSQDTFSFLLLNIAFIDSGNFTVFENYQEKGKTSILVTRRRLVGQKNEMMILSFMYNNENTSWIKIYGPTVDSILTIYNVTHEKCNYDGHYNPSRDRIENCTLNKWNFCLTIRELTFQEKGEYTSWNDRGFLLDSIFLDVRDDNTSSQQITNRDFYSSCIPDSPRSNEENVMTLWYLGSSVVVVFVAAFLAIVGVRKIRQRKVPKTTTHNTTHRNERQNTVSRSRNEGQNLEEGPSHEECRMISAQIDNADDPTDLMNNGGQGKVKLNEKHNCSRGLDSTKSAKKTASKFQIHSNLLLAKNLPTTDGYSHVRKFVHLKNERPLDEPYFSSTKSIAEPSFEYDHVVQCTSITSRAPAPDPVEAKKNKGQVMIADSSLRHTKVHKKSSSRVDPSTLYAKVNKKRTMETLCIDSNDEYGNRDFTSEFTPPGSFQLEEADLKHQDASQGVNYELARNVYDDSSAMERERKKNQSYGVLNGDLIVDASNQLPRSLDRTFMNEDYYDSLSSS